MGSTYQGNTKAIINLPALNRYKEIIFGSLIVGIWTLIRLFNHSPNFDQLGQQVLAHQWLNGMHSGSVIGPTNYVLKMIFIYMPLDLIPLPAQFKLVFMTLLVNIITFILLVYILKRLWLEFYPSIKDSFYWPMIYLALISGSVYWISFTNSRNLEVVGGLALMYLYVRVQKPPLLKYCALLVVFGGLLFFADPLQVYMTLLPILIFIGIRWVSHRNQEALKNLLKLIACAGLSVLLAHFLVKLVESTWNVSFIEAPRSLGFSLSSIKSAAEQTAKLYSGGYEGGRARELINLLIVIAGVSGVAYYAWRKPKSRQLALLMGTVWITDLSVYMFSGQAQQLDTNRYLIMTVPMFILALVVVLYYLPVTKTRNYIVTFIVLFNVLTLGAAFVETWNPGFSNNNHDHSVISYFKAHKYSYGYASIGTAISSDYLSNEEVNILTLGCEPDFTLKKTSLFFDKAAFNVAGQFDPKALVPIILDGKAIKINDAACGVSEIQKQLGTPQTIDYLGDGSTVLLYRVDQFHKLRSN